MTKRQTRRVSRPSVEQPADRDSAAPTRRSRAGRAGADTAAKRRTTRGRAEAKVAGEAERPKKNRRRVSEPEVCLDSSADGREPGVGKEPVSNGPGFRERLRGRMAERWRALVERMRRPLQLAFRVVVAVAVIAGGFAGYRLVERYVRSAPYFAIEEIEVEGLRRLTREDVLARASIAEGQNIFRQSAAEVQSQVEDLPWVASAAVERRLPGRFHLQIEERRAVAVLALGDTVYLVGDDGSLFKELEAGDPVDLPVVTGLSSARFLSDVTHRERALLDVVTLMHDYRSAGLWQREPIAEIHFEANDGLSIYTGDDGMLVRLSVAPWRPKLRRLRQILDRLDAQEARAEYVYLDNLRRPDRVTVRLRQTADPPPPPTEAEASSTADATPAARRRRRAG